MGDLGAPVIAWLDWLASARCGLWQFLPLGPTGFADSPYQSFSAFASNPLLVNLELLAADGYLKNGELPEPEPPSNSVDYQRAHDVKMPLLAAAADRLLDRPSEEFGQFREENHEWLEEYALFMALKERHQLRPWWEWDPGLRLRAPDEIRQARSNLRNEIARIQAQQFFFYGQWAAVKQAAAERDVLLVGDMPIFVALDSADVWANRGLFQLNEAGLPVAVAGVPPDYFSSSGQLWGNPLYDWERMHSNRYRWWKRRLVHLLSMVDFVRLDHFRGFEAYWRVPAGAQTAVAGKWEPGPGADLFEALQSELGELPIVAEDLGVITRAVDELRERFGLPGMKVLQFAFDGEADNTYLPHNYTRDMVAYTGTHDNDTLRGWFDSASPPEVNYARRYSDSYDRGIVWALLRLVWGSVANWAICPLQDLLELGSQARMNTPGTARGNWIWRASPGSYGQGLAARMRELNLIYGRPSSPATEMDPYGLDTRAKGRTR